MPATDNMCLLRKWHNDFVQKHTTPSTFIATGRIFSLCLSYDTVMPDTQSRHQKPRRKLKKSLKITVSSDKRLSTVTQRRVTYITINKMFSMLKCIQMTNLSIYQAWADIHCPVDIVVRNENLNKLKVTGEKWNLPYTLKLMKCFFLKKKV